MKTNYNISLDIVATCCCCVHNSCEVRSRVAFVDARRC